MPPTSFPLSILLLSCCTSNTGKIQSMHVPPEPGTIKAVVETLLKPFSLIFNPIAERIGNKFKRTAKLYINIRPATNVWCYAWNGNNPNPMMQVRFDADFTNESDREGIFILDVYVEGTKSRVPIIDHLKFPKTSTTFAQIIGLFCSPVVGEGGKDFTGRIIFVDQFKRKHRSDKTTFTWVGSTEPPKVG